MKQELLKQQALRQFYQHEWLILRLINHPDFRWSLGIKEKYPIVKVSPNSYHMLIDRKDNQDLVLARFNCDHYLLAAFSPILSMLEMASAEFNSVKQDPFAAGLHFAGIKRKSNLFPTYYLKTVNFNIGGSDGEVGCGGDPSFANMHNASNGGWTNQAANSVAQSNFGVDHTDKYWIKRPFLPFDTSSIGAGKVTGSKLYIYVNGSSHQWGGSGCFAVVVQTSQANTALLALSDYTQCGSVNNPTEGSNQLALATIVNQQNSYNYWTLNATGLGWINGRGISKLGLRCGIDYTQNDPGMGGNQGENFSWNNSYSASNKPYLEVTYTPAGGGAGTVFTFH